MENHSNVAIFIIAGVVVLGLAYSIYHYVKNGKGNERKKTPVHNPTIPEITQTSKEDNDSQIIKKEEKQVENEERKNIDSISSDLIIPYIKRLGSSIGGLFQISKNGDDAGTASSLYDNLDATFSYFDDVTLKSEWEAFTKDRNHWDERLYKDKSASLLRMLKQAGVEIPEQDILIWDEFASRRYRKFGEIADGDKCIVLSPYALFDGLILTEGLARKA